MRLSIIIPTRRFTDALAVRIEAHRRLFPDAEIIVVEPEDLIPGGPTPEVFRSDDRPSKDLLAGDRPQPRSAGVDSLAGAGISLGAHRGEANVQRLRAPRGRGTQCNVGAARATGPLLLFLHDDTALPVEAPALVRHAFSDPKTRIACFRLRFDHEHWLLTSYAFFSRFDGILTSFGDQGILIRRSFFATIGGFPDWPLFEDVALLGRARRRTRKRIKKLPAMVTTSAVRFLENGILRQQLLNAELILRFSLGASPESLRRRYEARRASHHAD